MDTNQMIDTRAAAVAQEFGIEENKIQKVKLELSYLRKNGLTIDIDIKGTSMFVRAANWAEYGIQGDADDKRKGRMRAGSKYVINTDRAEKIKSIETRMRQLAKKLTVHVKGLGDWLSWGNYPKFKEEWARLLDEWVATKLAILAGLDEDKDALAAEFAEIADAAWHQLTGMIDPATGQNFQWYIEGGKVYDHDSFVDKVVSSAIALIPTAKKEQVDLQADYVPGLVYGEEDVAADEAQAATIREKINLARTLKDAEIRALQLDMQSQEERVRHEAKLHQMEEFEKEAQIEAHKLAEIQHLKEVWAKEKSPFEEVFLHMRKEAATAAADMLDSIRKNSFVRGKIAEKGAGLLEWFDLMAIHDDGDLRNRLAMLKEAIGQIGDRDKDTPARNTAQIMTTLEEIKDLAAAAEADITHVSRFAFFEE